MQKHLHFLSAILIVWFFFILSFKTNSKKHTPLHRYFNILLPYLGMIFIWLISSTATILANKTKEEQIVISPYLIFNAHGTPVTSVSFSDLPGSRFLVSSSTDKTLKFWDLIDISKYNFNFFLHNFLY